MGAAFFFTTLLDTSRWPIHILSVYWTWELKQFRQLRSDMGIKTIEAGP